MIARPDVFFLEDGETPETVVLQTVCPAIEGMTPTEVAREIERRVREREQELRAGAKQAGRSFMGRAAVLAKSPFASPTTKEPRRKLSPRIATKDKGLRIRAIERLSLFLQQYRAAFSRWRQGLRDVLFPFGTYALRRFAAVPCAPGPAP